MCTFLLPWVVEQQGLIWALPLLLLLLLLLLGWTSTTDLIWME
jgi:hypothetical protein